MPVAKRAGGILAVGADLEDLERAIRDRFNLADSVGIEMNTDDEKVYLVTFLDHQGNAIHGLVEDLPRKRARAA